MRAQETVIGYHIVAGEVPDRHDFNGFNIKFYFWSDHMQSRTLPIACGATEVHGNPLFIEKKTRNEMDDVVKR